MENEPFWKDKPMKKEDIKRKDNIEKLSKVVEENKKIPKKIKEKISSKIFENLIYSAIIIVYLGALNLGISNIPTENYIVDLKVFSAILLIRNNNNIWKSVQKGQVWTMVSRGRNNDRSEYLRHI